MPVGRSQCLSTATRGRLTNAHLLRAGLARGGCGDLRPAAVAGGGPGGVRGLARRRRIGAGAMSAEKVYRTYDETQRQAVLVTCSRCPRTYYATHVREPEICAICRDESAKISGARQC